MNADQDSDESLMLRYAAGDAVAFDMLYQRHELRVWRFIRRHVGEQATADELMQEVWFTVAREASRYRPTARFTTWLYTLARNRAIDSLRTRHPHRSLDAAARDGEGWVETLAAAADSGPLPQLESQQSLDVVLRAVEQLPLEQRDAFLLQVEGELRVEEIATLTGVSFETTRSRLRYARNRLRQLLQEYA